MSTLRFLMLRGGDISVCGQNDFGIPSGAQHANDLHKHPYT